MKNIVVKDRNGNIEKISADYGMTLMEIIRDAGMDIEAACGGCCACATCHIYVDEKWLHLLNEKNDDEYIKTTLNNPNWLTGMLHTDDKSDINDLKLIKKSIDPSIKFELNVSDKGDELEKILNKEN